MAISFTQVGSFKGMGVGPHALNNPTSLQFGPDERLYVSEQNGTINAFTITIQNGEYVPTSIEEINLVKSIQNHNDNGSKHPEVNRQVTGLVTSGTASNPVLYVSSSDPRISQNGEKNLDTNSGVITRLTWNGTQWGAVDIIRGLPRSEENHATNGLVFSPDGTKLYVAQGGNTNNGAPSQFFSYAGEYALSGTVLEIDLADIESRAVLTDPEGGQGGTARKYIYDLPTLDDPSVANNGTREDANGLDVAGPWGGNDGFNMAILPADAPLRIYADGFRNQYDLVFTQTGKLYTVDNGSNANLGGDPLTTGGEATNKPNNGGTGGKEPLFLIEEGGYYGHPNPARSNQDLSWTVYDDNGNPDGTVSPNTTPNLSDLVPDSVDIEAGFIIDPSKFTGDPARLSKSGIRVPYDGPQTNALISIGSSSNGLVEYTGDAFGGELKGDLLVAQFNGNVGRLNLSTDGTAATYETIDGLNGLSTPLDVTMGPNGTVWVAEIGGDLVKVFAPSGAVLPDNPDIDNDGLFNAVDPFIRDATNGGSAIVSPGQSLLWDFDADQDNNLPGPNGYGGGLTGVMVNGTTDFEAFFQEPLTPGATDIKLDNVKFITAAGGGTTVIENVSNGDPFRAVNSGKYLFHTGTAIAPTVETFTIKWSLFNPGDAFTGNYQQIGGYIGTGDQSNYLKIVAIQHPAGEVQIVLEDNDVVASTSYIQANDLFGVQLSDSKKIFLELTVNPAAETATPTITYETANGTSTASGVAISLSGTAVLETIKGNYTVQGQSSQLAVGLFSANTGQSPADTFQAVFDDIEITATGDTSAKVLHRVNAGGAEVTAIDGGPNWSADTGSFRLNASSNNISAFSVQPGSTVASTTPSEIFQTERWDNISGNEMQWAFEALVPGAYEVRLFLGNGFPGTSAAGQRVFDVEIEGNLFDNLDNLDLSSQFGHQVGGMISNVVSVTDGTLDIAFLHTGADNPLVNGIEVIRLGSEAIAPVVSIIGGSSIVLEGANAQISLLTNVTVPSDETVTVTFEITPGTATPQEDYDYVDGVYNAQTGVYTGTAVIAGSSSDATFNIDILTDAILETNEAFTVTITDVGPNARIGNASATVTIEDNTVSEGTVVAINAGGPALSQGGIDFMADQFFNNGQTFTDNNAANGTQPVFDGTIYETERYGGRAGAPPLSYVIPVAAGNYAVELHFAEIFFPQNATGGVGQRIFDVTVEGQQVLDDVDILALTSGDINQPVVFQLPGNVSPDTFGDPNAIDISFQGSADKAKVSGIVIRPANLANPMNGAATVSVTLDSNDIQKSNFGGNSFLVQNIGSKKITKVEMDVTEALYPDTVFDPFGTAGDTVSKALTINANDGTGVIAPTQASYLGEGGIAGFEAIQILFDSTVDGGFEPGETLGFSIDMDPNSIAGATKSVLDSGANPTWDIGGVSGAELIGSMVTVTFSDGTIATSQLQGAGNQAGAQTLVSQALLKTPVTITVNGLAAGETGTYSASEPQVLVNGPAGQTARVILTKGFIQPVNNNFTGAYKAQLDAQLVALEASDFPANNAVEFQTVDVLLTGEAQDISSLFNFTEVPVQGVANPDQLPLGFVASVVDSGNNNLPIGPVTQPIYLKYEESTSLQPGNVLYRVNAGGQTTAATDGGPVWREDTQANNSEFLVNAGSNTDFPPSGLPTGPIDMSRLAGFAVPEAVLGIERWDGVNDAAGEMQWAFDVPAGTEVEVRLYLAEVLTALPDLDNSGDATGDRIFNVSVDGTVPTAFTNIDPYKQAGNAFNTGSVVTHTLISDGTIDLTFLHGSENPALKGIEIVAAGTPPIPAAFLSFNAGAQSADASTFTNDYARITKDLLALYTFEEGSGGIVRDVSGTDTALDLNIDDLTGVSWGDGTLTLNDSTLIASAGAATEIIDSLIDTSEFTIEAWLTPENSTGGVVTTDLTHLVYSREADGDVSMYVDGALVKTSNIGGNFSNWSEDFRFALGNEFQQARAWLGTLDLVAVYSQALDADSVTQNFVAGADTLI